MVVKPYESNLGTTSGRRLQAGAKAEAQLAHYLDRAFADNPDVHLLHGLRLVDPQQPEREGAAAVCQIDHLVVHNWGMFIVESKSVTGTVVVRPDGSGGDDWERTSRDGRPEGMASPIKQAERQSDFLRRLLQRHRSDLLARHRGWGMRLVARWLTGTDQRGFKYAPIQLIVALSDSAVFRREDGWIEPSEPFAVFVSKASHVPDKIGNEIRRHRGGGKPMRDDGRYGVYQLMDGEAAAVAQFLAERHLARRRPVARKRSTGKAVAQTTHSSAVASVPARRGTGPVCKACGGVELTARSGRFGYYWRCTGCQENTSMHGACRTCGATNRAVVRVRRTGSRYRRECEACGDVEQLWDEALQR